MKLSTMIVERQKDVSKMLAENGKIEQIKASIFKLELDSAKESKRAKSHLDKFIKYKKDGLLCDYSDIGNHFDKLLRARMNDKSFIMAEISNSLITEKIEKDPKLLKLFNRLSKLRAESVIFQISRVYNVLLELGAVKSNEDFYKKEEVVGEVVEDSEKAA